MNDVTTSIPTHLLEPLVIYSVRYCLGRHSYVVGNAENIVKATWKYLPDRARDVLIRHVGEFVDASHGSWYSPHPPDLIATWRGLLEFMRKHQEDTQEETPTYPPVWRSG